jgi:hypothetical protein
MPTGSKERTRRLRGGEEYLSEPGCPGRFPAGHILVTGNIDCEFLGVKRPGRTVSHSATRAKTVLGAPKAHRARVERSPLVPVRWPACGTPVHPQHRRSWAALPFRWREWREDSLPVDNPVFGTDVPLRPAGVGTHHTDWGDSHGSMPADLNSTARYTQPQRALRLAGYGPKHVSHALLEPAHTAHAVLAVTMPKDINAGHGQRSHRTVQRLHDVIPELGRSASLSVKEI